MPEMKCPICGIVLEADEIYDGIVDDKHKEEEWFGHCPQCGKHYHWTLVFVYKDVTDFGEVEEEN